MSRKLLAAILLALLATPLAQAFPGGSVKELMTMLIRANHDRVDMASAEKGCGAMMAAKKGDKVDLGELLGFLLEKLGYGDGKNAIRPECDLKGDHLRTCTLWFAGGAGTPSFWRGSVRFDFDPATKKVDPKSISCPGAS